MAVCIERKCGLCCNAKVRVQCAIAKSGVAESFSTR